MSPLTRIATIQAEAADEDSEANESDGTLAERLEAVEAELQKIKDTEAKKKADDALKPAVKPRGRLHTDANWFDQSPANRATVGDIQDGTYFRRARLGFDAKAFEITEYRLDFEMASGGGRPSIFDAYGRVIELPLLGNLQVGHFREPFSLEAQTSSNWFTFIERALNNTFDPSRNWGVMTFNHNEDESVTWAVGVFREGSDNFGDDIGDSGERAATTRVTWLPYYDEPSEGRYFFEVGGSYSYRDPDNRFIPGPGGAEESIVRYQGRPEDNLNEDGVGSVPAFVSVSIPDAIDVQIFGVESSWNLGSLNLQSEYIGSLVDRADAATDVFFHGAYFQASYFLTGEARQWDKAIGTFGRAEVYEPFFRVATDRGICTSRGAWEIAARWNYLDLSDDDLLGGYLEASTLGLNWYLSPYMRAMFNYEYVDLHDPVDGRSNVNVFHARLDWHF
jgi:phosphate-selective porin OprO/OprP